MYGSNNSHARPQVAPFLLSHLEGNAPTFWCEEKIMLYYALIFLVIGLIAGALGVSGVAAIASQIAWVLFIIGLVLLLVHFVSGRRSLVP